MSFARFLIYLVSAIEDSFPQCCGGLIELVQQSPIPTIEALTDVLIHRLTELSTPLVLGLGRSAPCQRWGDLRLSLAISFNTLHLSST